MIRKKYVIPLMVLSMCIGGCSQIAKIEKNSSEQQILDEKTEEEKIVEQDLPDEETTEKYVCIESDAHAIEVDGKEESYENIVVEKTGDSEGDEADFYGTNAAVYASNGATLTICNSKITTDGVHANGVFSYGKGTEVNISDSEISTEKATSGGIMVTGGGTLNANNLTVTTQSGSSAPIRSDRGGGQLNVKGGTYESYGSGSPAIYSTAEINVEEARLYSDISEAVVVEGKNSVNIINSEVVGSNTVHNSDKADVYRNVMIYQSMSGDSEEGKGEFTMTGGSLTAKNGGMFFVTNTVADINLENVSMQYATDDLLRIEKAGWGSDGSNGGQVTFNATNQSLEGNITVDEISVLNMYIKDGSSFKGSIESTGKTYVDIEDDSTWILTADSEISGLTCDEDAINLNGYTLKIAGENYIEGTKSSGEAIEIVAPISKDGERPEPPEGMKDGERPEPPEGMKDSERPELPEGMKDGERPEPPEGMKDGEQPEPPEGMKDGERPEPPEGMKDGERPENENEITNK